MELQINGRLVQAQDGEMILEVLRREGVNVPTLCHMADLFPTGACRMCVVEVEGQRTLIPSCAYPAADGMIIKTHSPRVLRARKTIVELLLSNHPDDCLYCVRNGNCELQQLAEELGVRERRYAGNKDSHHIDTSSPAIVRDPAKCILCGRCVRVCEEIQGVSALDFTGRGSKTVVGTAFKLGLNVSSCINCGQCVMVCPTGALREQSHIKEVLNAISDPDLFVVVQHAPAVSVTLAEALGMKPGLDIDGVMTTALRMIGFDRVYETSFTADLTIMEEAGELVHRIKTGGILPMMTSCSPGWIKFVEQFYPDFIGNLSSCKSPQQMMGAVVKSILPQYENIGDKRIFSVSIMPCTAKKFEAQRPEMMNRGVSDVDAVLTTRELARIIRMKGLALNALAPSAADSPFGQRSTAGKLFGATGGVMEAAVRTAFYLLTGEDMPDPKISALRGMKNRKEASITIGDLNIGVAVVGGLGEARKLLEEIKRGRSDLHFIEVMTCPGGCIAGGGQVPGVDPQAVQARMHALYAIDRDEHVQFSHRNTEVQRLYNEVLGEPLGEKSHKLLHTHYALREAVL
ncbi:MAG: iron hydrogenase small subunit [Sedimentisphaerales bacterium]|nr:iron hydrogenase small subunit [Sedimentisphaerales bacterium]